MYYHVLVQTTPERTKGAVPQTHAEFDKQNLADIEEDFVGPYVNGKEFSVDGYRVTPENIMRLVIKTSELQIDAMVRRINDEIPKGVLMYVGKIDALEEAKHFRDVTKDLLKAAHKQSDPKPAAKPKATDRTAVFIVHGHDELAKTAAARFVESLGLRAIILHEQPSAGTTIIEKIEAYSDVGFGIVLYTPDDVGAAKSDSGNIQPRARQNVVFEHGYLIGKLGRKSVTALVKGRLERPNDISGVVYIDMDDRGGWRYDVAKEMRDCGYTVDMNRL